MPHGSVEEAAELAMWSPSFRLRGASIHRSREARLERVSLDLGLSRVRAGRCYECGSPIEPALHELGSLRCLDCGDPHVNGKSPW
jgi:hypothetical protein